MSRIDMRKRLASHPKVASTLFAMVTALSLTVSTNAGVGAYPGP